MKKSELIIEPEIFMNRQEYQLKWYIDNATKCGLSMNNDFNRDYFYTREDEESLLDSIFNGLDIGSIKVYFVNDVVVVIDGKQRLTTIIKFLNDEITFKDYYYSELPFKYKRMFTHRILYVYNIEPRVRGTEVDFNKYHKIFNRK